MKKKNNKASVSNSDHTEYTDDSSGTNNDNSKENNKRRFTERPPEPKRQRSHDEEEHRNGDGVYFYSTCRYTDGSELNVYGKIRLFKYTYAMNIPSLFCTSTLFSSHLLCILTHILRR